MITGGHPAPALAVIDQLKNIHPECKIIFVGRRYNNAHEQSDSFEFQEVQKRSIQFINLNAGRVTRLISIQSFLQLLRIPLGFVHSLFILTKYPPDAILTFGGYLGLPIAFVGYLFGIPIYTHEQTIQPGTANRLIAHFAKKVFVSFEQSKIYFTQTNCVVTGNPIRASIFKKKSGDILIDQSKQCLYITGGSLGSHAINVLIEKIAPKLLQTYTLIHQTGNIEEFADFDRLMKLKKTLPKNMRRNYILRKHIFDDEIGFVYASSSLVIGRSGANTWFELVALQKPAILIPLPWSAFNEQQQQAELLQSYGVAKLFNQEHSSEQLLELINQMMDNIHGYEEAYKNHSSIFNPNAAQQIIARIFS